MYKIRYRNGQWLYEKLSNILIQLRKTTKVITIDILISVNLGNNKVIREQCFKVMETKDGLYTDILVYCIYYGQP